MSNLSLLLFKKGSLKHIMRYRFLRFPNGKEKALTLSYDDGVVSDTHLIEIADKYGIKVTLNINSDWMGNPGRLSADTLKNMAASGGHEIAVHGARHIANGNVSAVDGIRDVLECRQRLENAFDTIIRGMAYPDCGITASANNSDYQKVREYLADLGIVYSRSLNGDNDLFRLPTDWYNWIPTAHHENGKIMNYIDKFNKDYEANHSYIASRSPLLFYMWGHSFEFEKNNNWDRLEAICEKLGNQPDVWYATNIQIYDYVTAYNSLIFSADGYKVYNPTLQKIWFEVDTKPYVIDSGETIKLD